MPHNIALSYEHSSAYPIIVGQQIASDIQSFCTEHYNSAKAIVVIDEKVARLHAEKVRSIFDSCFEELLVLPVPEGEHSKSTSKWQQLTDTILKEGVERKTPLIGVGGGVTGDLAGFIAATTLRGLPLIHMPTSLLAMVDSSIGGKTGVNHSAGKNLIGSFYQPDAVFADTRFLETLEQSEWITGLAEILKYAAIHTPSLFDQLASLVQKPLQPNEEWTKVIAQSASIKADVVEADVHESGQRAYLNFGHTFGHALEKVAGYGSLSHGEAVFIGMIAAARACRQLGYPINNVRFEAFLPLYKKQITSVPTDVDALIEAMKTDKKVKNDRLQLVLLKKWASPYIQPCTDFSLLKDAWKYALSHFT